MDTIDNCDFDWFYENLSAGQKQHLANRLYKRDGIIPQRLPPAPPVEPVSYPVGSRFEDVNGREYMLAFTGSSGGQMGLINIRTGYPYRAPANTGGLTHATAKDLKSMGPESGLYYLRQTGNGTRAEAVY